MRVYLFAMIMALIPLSAAQAQTVTVWQGKAEIVGATPAATCAAGHKTGPKKFDYQPAMIRLANISDNGTDTRLTFIHRDRAMIRMVVAGQNFAGSGSYAGRKLTGKGGSQDYVGNFSGVVVTPGTITATTMYVHVNGTFTNFFNNTGCTVTIRAAYTRRLN